MRAREADGTGGSRKRRKREGSYVDVSNDEATTADEEAALTDEESPTDEEALTDEAASMGEEMASSDEENGETSRRSGWRAFF